MPLYLTTAAALVVQLFSSLDLRTAPAWAVATAAVVVAWRVFAPPGARMAGALGPAAFGAFIGLAALAGDGGHHADGLTALLDGEGRASQSYEIVADVIEPPKRGQVGSSAVLAVRSAAPVTSGPAGAMGTPITGKMLLSVRHASGKLRFGNTVRLRTRPRSITNLGNPGEFDFAAWYARQGIAVSGFVWDERDIEDLGPAPVLDVITRARAAIGAAAQQDRGAGGALTASLVVGDRSGLDATVLEALRRSGLFHLLAISGMNIAVVAGFALWAVGAAVAAAGLPRSGRDPYRPAAAAAALAVILYALLSGGGDSVLRSTVMGLLMLMALWRGSRGDGARGLATAALVVSLAAPGGVTDVGFQLTFVATAAVLVAVGVVTRTRCPPRVLPVLSAVVISVWCWAVTAPLLAYHFQRISLLAPIASLAAGIPAAVVVVAGLVGAAVLPVSDWLAGRAFDLAALAGDTVLWIARLAAAPAWAEQLLVRPGASMAASLAALPLIVLAPPLSRRRLAWALSVVTAASAAGATFDRYRSDRMDVVFASVGQGDATIVRLPGGEVLVVDAGPPGRGRSVVGPTLRRMYIRRIDYLVVTHGQDDHWGGLAELAAEFEIGELWYPGGACDGAFVALLRELEARGTRIVDVGHALDDRDDAQPSLTRRGRSRWRVRALWPRGVRGRCDENDRSVVLAVSFARFRVLLTGDIEAPAERVLATRRRLGAHLLKVAHHGSRTSSTPAFLAAVRPLAAVASLGSANRFRFPHPEVVGRYERDGTRLYRTDRDGAVQAVITRDALVVAASRAASVRFSRAGLRDRVD